MRTIPTEATRPARPKAMLGMSGGVDSSVASFLLQQSGYDVIGLHLVTHDAGWAAAEDARIVSGKLGHELVVLDVRAMFRQRVIDDFVNAWLMGQTPNPCIRCNPDFKFRILLEEAARHGCTHLASGHYAGIRRHPGTGRLALHRTGSGRKDQTYFLYRLSQEQLGFLLFPLESYQKDQVRNIAGDLGLAGHSGSLLAAKPDSQDICFIPEGDYAAYIRQAAEDRGLDIRHQLFLPGPVVDTQGHVLGRHQGLIHYTFGQRKGFDVRTTERLFVLGKDLASNTLVVGSFDQVMRNEIRISDVVYSGLDHFEQGQETEARIRSSSGLAACRVFPQQDGDLLVRFDEPVSAPATGQSCVFYDHDLIVAGGIITMS